MVTCPVSEILEVLYTVVQKQRLRRRVEQSQNSKQCLLLEIRTVWLYEYCLPMSSFCSFLFFFSSLGYHVIVLRRLCFPQTFMFLIQLNQYSDAFLSAQKIPSETLTKFMIHRVNGYNIKHKSLFLTAVHAWTLVRAVRTASAYGSLQTISFTSALGSSSW